VNNTQETTEFAGLVFTHLGDGMYMYSDAKIEICLQFYKDTVWIAELTDVEHKCIEFRMSNSDPENCIIDVLNSAKTELMKRLCTQIDVLNQCIRLQGNPVPIPITFETNVENESVDKTGRFDHVISIAKNVANRIVKSGRKIVVW